MKTCRVAVCQRRAEERGYCHSHYEYRRRTGTEPTHKLHSDYTIAERFAMKTQPGPDGCVLWTGGADGGGRYGSFFYEGRVQRAHRVAWQMAHGHVDPDLDLDHLCRVTLCVNPEHLEPVTHRENVLRGESLQAQNARKTHCRRGHPFTGDNVIRRGNNRICRACSDLRNYYRRLIGPDVTAAEIDYYESLRQAVAA